MKRRPLSPITVARETCVDFESASRLEWLETNGTGGFAMGTVSGASTRRYHGLLVAPRKPPAERQVFLAKLDEVVVMASGGHATELATNQYPFTIHPRGFERLIAFRLDPFPTWTFEIASGVRVEKRLFLVQGEQTVIVQYRATARCHLSVQPLVAFRDYHAIGRANDRLDPSAREVDDEGGDHHHRDGAKTIHIRPYPDQPAMRIVHSGRSFIRNGAFHHDVEYLRELDRGLDFREDLYRVGTIEIDLEPGRDAFVAATFAERSDFSLRSIADLERSERERRMTTIGQRAASHADTLSLRSIEDPLVARLTAAADQFLVTRVDGSPTVIAGYPWFTDWGRDTMIALPGLLIARGRLDEAARVIEGFLAHLDKGLIPNRFPDYEGEPLEYNTVDATLWLFIVLYTYLEAGGDPALLHRIFPKLMEILGAHIEGTHHGIKVDPEDGLLVAGAEGTQLTWMDARVDGVVCTPRHGKPVEINALFCNALLLGARWAALVGEDEIAATLAERGTRVAEAFERSFWNEAKNCLFDVLLPDPDRDGRYVGDPRVRPNQIIALSLPLTPLSEERCKRVLEVAERELLTPVGLRTLARSEPGYEPRYQGGPRERDRAYHQGVVWPWLLGPFVRAYLNVHGRSAERIAWCRALFRGLELHLQEACLGTISELFEAEAPFRADGAPAQAWSVAELLDVLDGLGESDCERAACAPSVLLQERDEPARACDEHHRDDAHASSEQSVSRCVA